MSHQSVMHVRRMLPTAELRSLIDCYWTGRFEHSPSPTRSRVGLVPFLPGAGGVEIFIHLRGGFAIGGETSLFDHVSCWRREAVAASCGAGSEFFVIRLRAGAAIRLLPCPIAEIADPLTGVDDVWGPAGKYFSEAIRSAERDSERTALADRFFRAQLLPERGAAIAWAVSQLEREHVRIETLAGATGLSVRQFEIRFLAATGNSPVRFRSLARLRRSIKKLAAANASLASLLDDGYFDQAQQIRDFRKFTGMTPGDFRRVLQSGPHFYNLPAQARASLLLSTPTNSEVA